jgi:hypothetical protein
LGIKGRGLTEVAKIDLALINSNGHGRRVPKEMDRHIVKFVVEGRKSAVEADLTLLQTYRWDHSDVFYAARTWLNKHGWDTSVYNDNVAGGSNRRKELYDMIKPVCEDYFHVKRHQIGIYPEDRAVLAYNGVMYAASFDNLQRLMYSGTDVIPVEKQGTVIKMMPFTVNTGVAFIQSQGFISEYGIALARLGNQDFEAGEEYLGRVPAAFKGNLGSLTDCDSSGVVIGTKIKGATRIGIDVDTIDEINQVNEGLEDELDIDLPIEREDLEESTSPNSHWEGLNGILEGTGKLYNELSPEEIKFYRKYLTSMPSSLRVEGLTVIDYLRDHRIELNTVLAAIKPQAFWNWLKWKLLQIWPDRDYRRGGLMLTDVIRTPTYNRFKEFYDKRSESITEASINETRLQVAEVKGLYDDVDGFKDNVQIIKKVIQGDILNNVLLPNEEIQKIDLALERIMKNGNGKGKGKGKKKAELDNTSGEDNNVEDEDDDGNEWND